MKYNILGLNARFIWKIRLLHYIWYIKLI